MSLSRHRVGVTCAGTQIAVAVALLIALGAVALLAGSDHTKAAANRAIESGVPVRQAKQNTALAAYAQLPLIFERNDGQSDPRVRFLARGSGYGLFLTKNSAVLSLHHADTQHHSSGTSVLAMDLSHANPNPEVTGTDQLPGKSNYFIGNDPAKWHRGVPQFARVRYQNVYPGVDLVFYGNRERLEYDFEIAPGSDPRPVALKLRGLESAQINSGGDLLIALDSGNLRLQAPVAYQQIGGEKHLIESRFELRARNEVGFSLGEYDHRRPLVIDPILTYSTYLGGSADEGCSVILGTGTPLSGCPAIAVDQSSNAYIAGSTTSTDFPTVAPYQSTKKGTANVFVSKFNASANTLLFSTYLGGSGTDYTAGVGVDQGFDVVVGGTTNSTDFPTSVSGNGTNAPFQKAPISPGNDHAFVSELDPTGTILKYSTYLSGNGVDKASGLAVDSSGNAYLTGTTTSTESQTGFPSTLGAIQTTSRAPSQFFLTKVSPVLSGPSSVPYSTYIGGSTPSNGQTLGGGVAVDPALNVYVTGGTNFTDMPVLNAYQATNNGGFDVFVTKINPTATSGQQLLYSTYFGGSGDDIGYGIAADSTDAYVTGSTTSSTNFPASGTGVYQSTFGGGTSDAFLAKFTNPVTTGTTQGLVTLDYSTFIGGSGTDVGLAVAVDTIQGARVTGWTNSSNIPNSVIQTGLAGVADAFVARIDTTATTPTAPGHYFTYLGGGISGTGAPATTYGTSIAVDPQNASYVAGETDTNDLLTQAPPVNTAFRGYSGGTDAFLSKLGPLLSMNLSVPTVSPAEVGVGNQVTFQYTITNTGDVANNVNFTDNLPTSGATFVSATASPGTCSQANGGVVGCFIGTLNAGATATASVVVTPTANTIPSTTPVVVGNSAQVAVSGAQIASNFGSVTVNDFNIAVAPATATVPAGVPASYTATITPTGNIPETVSLSCSAGLPTGATCTETTNPIPNLSSGPVSTVLVINTTARVTTTTELRRSFDRAFASLLPISGLALLGVGLGSWRKRRWLLGILLAGFFSLIVFQASCSSSSPVSTTSGTPAGTYVVTVTATSGSATRNATVTLVVQ